MRLMMVFVSLLAGAAGGCRDTDSSSPDGPLPLADGAVSADTAVPTATVQLKLESSDTALSISGAEVCVLEQGAKGASCDSSDASGKLSVEVPMSAETGVFIEASGFQKTFLPLWLTGNTTLPPLVLFSDAFCNDQYPKAGGSYPPTDKGHIAINGKSGASVSPLSAAGAGPVYFDATGALDPAAGTMSDPFPAGFLFDVPPGAHDLSVALVGETCTGSNLGVGWPSSSTTVKAAVFAGYLTVVATTCN